MNAVSITADIAPCRKTTQEEKRKLVSELVTRLKECSRRRDLQGGKKVHIDAVEAGCHTSEYVSAALINMYGKCGSTQSAWDVFKQMTHRNVVCWTSLILGYVENGESDIALELFTSMDCEPDSFTFVAALKACAKSESIDKGMDIHKQVRKLGMDTNVVVGTALIDMYSKCGSMLQAKEVFDRITYRNVVSWSCLIMGYVENGESSVAMEVFTTMDCPPNSVTFVAVCKACGCLATEETLKKHACLETGTALHREAKQRGFDADAVLTTTLVDMYSKCGCMHHARFVFDRMLHRSVVSWNCVILGYVENGESLVALELFRHMGCLPNSVTYVAALKACVGLGNDKQLCVEYGMAIHKQARECGVDSEIIVATSLVDMYGKCGRMEFARYVFDRVIHRDVVLWNCLILGYVENAEGLTALELYSSMDCEANSLTFMAALKSCAVQRQVYLENGMAIHSELRERGLDVGNTLLDMYTKCGDMRLARCVFDEMVHRDIVSWTCLILGYVENAESSLAMDLFTRMDVEPDSFTYAAVLKACGNLSTVSSGLQIHTRMCRRGLEQTGAIANSLVGFYTKCGSMSCAEHVFNGMHSRDIETWNTLISGYSMLGDTRRVFTIQSEVHESHLRMDGNTFVCILGACSHAGMVEQGKQYFGSMPRYGVKRCIEHYTCIVDMLGRANRLEEALSVIKTMPFETDYPTWRSLLGACKTWKNAEVGKVAFDALVAANEADAADYVMMGQCM